MGPFDSLVALWIAFAMATAFAAFAACAIGAGFLVLLTVQELRRRKPPTPPDPNAPD